MSSPAKDIPMKGLRTKKRKRKTKLDDNDYYESDAPAPSTVVSRTRPKRNAAREIEVDEVFADPDFDEEVDDADLIDHPSILTSQVQTRRQARESKRKADLENFDLEAEKQGNIKDEEGGGQTTTTTTTPPLIETEGIEVSPFAPMPNLWDNLQFNPLPREEATPSEASGEGESIVSGSKPDRDEEFYFYPEPQAFVDTITQVQQWLTTDPSKYFPLLKVYDGPSTKFSTVAILFGVPIEIIGDGFIPYGVPAGMSVEDAA
ncbi:hypothetical protein VE04_08457 [Pseudogymnoascus sp. 24MN13]|nr:hypothetical protein VE04_08457 [Pseudogymnoascus sp. 24MN13]